MAEFQMKGKFSAPGGLGADGADAFTALLAANVQNCLELSHLPLRIQQFMSRRDDFVDFYCVFLFSFFLKFNSTESRELNLKVPGI